MVALSKEPTNDSFCLRPKPYNKNLKANTTLRLEFSCYKATLYEAAPNAFFVFHLDAAICEDFDLPTRVPGPAVPQETTIATVIHQWPPNNFKMKFGLQMISSVRGGWRIALQFSKPVAEISSLNTAKFVSKSKDGLTYYIENFPGQIQNANLKQCEKIKIEFSGKLASSSNTSLTADVLFQRKEPEYAEVNLQGTCPTKRIWTQTYREGWCHNDGNLSEYDGVLILWCYELWMKFQYQGWIKTQRQMKPKLDVFLIRKFFICNPSGIACAQNPIEIRIGMKAEQYCIWYVTFARMQPKRFMSSPVNDK